MLSPNPLGTRWEKKNKKKLTVLEGKANCCVEIRIPKLKWKFSSTRNFYLLVSLTHSTVNVKSGLRILGTRTVFWSKNSSASWAVIFLSSKWRDNVSLDSLHLMHVYSTPWRLGWFWLFQAVLTWLKKLWWWLSNTMHWCWYHRNVSTPIILADGS